MPKNPESPGGGLRPRREGSTLPLLPNYPDLELEPRGRGEWALRRIPPWLAQWADRDPRELEGSRLPAGLGRLGQALASVAEEIDRSGSAVEAYCVEFVDARGEERAAMVQAWPVPGGAGVRARLMDVSGAVRAQKEAVAELPFHGIVGRARATREMVRRIEVYGPVDTPVLVTGETGSGKELVARALHELSADHRQGPLLALNCAALSPELLESELFGHERGAFTGAHRTHQGLFERAHGGTLFLDEIGEMPPPAQAKLLRALERGQVVRVGGERSMEVDVRFIGATNVSLERAVAKKRFRADLYHRIAVLRIHVPPLRERQEDIPLLVDFFLEQLARRHGRRVARVSSEAMTVLLSYSWPGNVRELRNTLERLYVESPSGVIGWRAMEEWIRERTLLAEGAETPRRIPETIALPPPAEKGAGGEGKEEELRRALAESGWNVSRAARRLGIHRATLYRRMKRAGIRKPGEEEER